MTAEQEIELANAMLYVLSQVKPSHDYPTLHQNNMREIIDSAQAVRTKRILSGEQQSGVINDT